MRQLRPVTSVADRHVARLRRGVNLFATCAGRIGTGYELKVMDHNVNDRTYRARLLPGRLPVRVWVMRSVLTQLRDFVLYDALNLGELKNSRASHSRRR